MFSIGRENNSGDKKLSDAANKANEITEPFEESSKDRISKIFNHGAVIITLGRVEIVNGKLKGLIFFDSVKKKDCYGKQVL